MNLKRLWDNGFLPTVKKGFYGETLVRGKVSREHLLPKSLGGTMTQGNIVLADRFINSMRGSEPLSKFATEETTQQYLEQFRGIQLPKFNGDKYIQKIKATLQQLLSPETTDTTVKHMNIIA